MRYAIPFLAIFTFLLAATAGAQESAAPAALKPADFEFKLRGYCLAGSQIEDSEAPGGFYAAPNFPKQLDRSEFVPETIVLRAYPGDAVPFADEFEGMRIVLVNGTGEVKSFRASDSRLAIVQEAQDADGTWKPIEYLPSSFCGNSYHRVFLGEREFWEFAAPRYSGSMETKLRFALTLDDGTLIRSNEFAGSINPDQFTTEQGHVPTDIMDPYTN